MQIILQKNDPRLGVLTWEGQYRWPAVNIANGGYQVPNVEPHYLKEKPDDRGGRWFVILCAGYFDAEVSVGEVVTVEQSLASLEAELTSGPSAVETVSDPLPEGETVDVEPTKPRPRSKRKASE